MSDTNDKTVDDWEDVGYCLASAYRAGILRTLSDDAMTPKEIADASEIPMPNVSRELGNLRDHDLVELLTHEERKKGRLYRVTDAGQWVLSEVEDR